MESIQKSICYICKGAMPKFAITPLLELADGSLQQCCQECANTYIPGWEEENIEDEENEKAK